MVILFSVVIMIIPSHTSLRGMRPNGTGGGGRKVPHPFQRLLHRLTHTNRFLGLIGANKCVDWHQWFRLVKVDSYDPLVPILRLVLLGNFNRYISIGEMHNFIRSPSCLEPLLQSKGKWEGIDMKMNFYSHGNKTHFHKKGLVLEVTVIRNQKWPFYSLVQRDSERKMRDVFNQCFVGWSASHQGKGNIHEILTCTFRQFFAKSTRRFWLKNEVAVVFPFEQMD